MVGLSSFARSQAHFHPKHDPNPTRTHPVPPPTAVIAAGPNTTTNAASRPLPGPRFCHVAVVWRHSLFVFGGYDGSARLGDLLEFKFGPGAYLFLGWTL